MLTGQCYFKLLYSRFFAYFGPPPKKTCCIPFQHAYNRNMSFIKKVFQSFMGAPLFVILFFNSLWTPIFPKASAVVSESGGMLSHCAIVAREYGIPSVVSALGVMNLKDGQILTVDANAGVVYTHEEG